MNHVEDAVKKEQIPAYNSSEIIREAGLDRSPHDIAREYYARQQSVFWRLVYRRQNFLETERLNGRQGAILLRAISWSVYTLCMAGILIAGYMGWISLSAAGTLAGALAAAGAVAAAAAGTLALAGAAAAAAAGALAGVDRSDVFKEPFLRSLRIVLGRAFLYFPFMPAVRLFDLWAERKRNDMPFMRVTDDSVAPSLPKRRLGTIRRILAAKREAVLRREKLFYKPNAILLRAISWSVYTLCMTGILYAALMGWISWPVALAGAGAIAFAAAVAVAGAGAAVLAAAVAGALAGALASAGAAALAIASAAAAVLAAVLAGVDRSDVFKEPFLHSLRIVIGRAFLYFPFMPFLRFFDYRIAKRLAAPKRIPETLQAALLPAEHIRQTYLSGIARVRERLLGDSSELVRSRNELEERLARLQTDRERVEHRKRQAEDDESQDRIATLSALLNVLDKRERPLRQTLGRLQGIVSKSRAFLLECEAKVSELDGPLGDAELARSILADGEQDPEAIERANLAIQQHVEELGNAVMRLHGTIAQATLPAHATDEDLTRYFEHVEAVAEEVATLHVEAERLPDATVH
jgi:hypothetical protein